MTQSHRVEENFNHLHTSLIFLKWKKVYGWKINCDTEKLWINQIARNCLRLVRFSITLFFALDSTPHLKFVSSYATCCVCLLRERTTINRSSFGEGFNSDITDDDDCVCSATMTRIMSGKENSSGRRKRK